jgi:hypothetical protein
MMITPSAPRTADTRFREVAISEHAIDRFVMRTSMSIPRHMARNAIAVIAGSSKARAVPRHWMRRFTSAQPGTRYLYNSAFPGICLVERGGTIVTVYTKEACRRWRDGTTRACIMNPSDSAWTTRHRLWEAPPQIPKDLL